MQNLKEFQQLAFWLEEDLSLLEDYQPFEYLLQLHNFSHQ